MRTLIAATLAAFSVAAPAHGQDGGLIERIQRLESRLATLEKAIIASPEACGTLGPGWMPYEAAEGRFLLGHGGPYPETGGAATVTLDKTQMPEHDHQVTWGHRHSVSLNDTTGDKADDHQYRLDWGNEYELGRADNNLIATYSGNSKPHENMPPYRAVHFCRKG